MLLAVAGFLSRPRLCLCSSHGSTSCPGKKLPQLLLLCSCHITSVTLLVISLAVFRITQEIKIHRRLRCIVWAFPERINWGQGTNPNAGSIHTLAGGEGGEQKWEREKMTRAPVLPPLLISSKKWKTTSTPCSYHHNILTRYMGQAYRLDPLIPWGKYTISPLTCFGQVFYHSGKRE